MLWVRLLSHFMLAKVSSGLVWSRKDDFPDVSQGRDGSRDFGQDVLAGIEQENSVDTY